MLSRILRRAHVDQVVTSESILDSYVRSVPSAQNAVDIFAGEWSSLLPDPLGEVRAGTIPLFADERVSWAIEHIGDLTGRTVLELGPLEGGHTFLLSKAGARVTAVEMQTRAYLKCLIAKELLDIRDAQFLLGDFEEYLRSGDQHFDVCFASGVLYHMRNPIETIALLSKAADRLFLWTHVYDERIVGASELLTSRFSAHEHASYDGFAHTLHRFPYAEALTGKGFCGGSAEFSNWLSREDLIAALEHFGWRVDAAGFDHPDHPHGPALALVATLR